MVDASVEIAVEQLSADASDSAWADNLLDTTCHILSSIGIATIALPVNHLNQTTGTKTVVFR